MEGENHVTIGDDDWGEDVNYADLVFIQDSTVEELDDGTCENPHIKYDHILKMSCGKVNRLWVLLEN